MALPPAGFPSKAAKKTSDMALSCAAFMPVRALVILRRKTLEINKDIWSNWTSACHYRTKPGVIPKHRYSPPETVHKGKTCDIGECKHITSKTNECEYTRLIVSDGIVRLRTGPPDLLQEFPQPKNLLYATLSRSLGLSDLSQYIQYSCTDGEVKVRCGCRCLDGSFSDSAYSRA